MNKMNKKGFTLIEMLVVIAIIAILVSIIVPVVGNSTTKASAATNAANLRSVSAAVAIKYLENPTAYTTGTAITAVNGKLTLVAAGTGTNATPAITLDAPVAKGVKVDTFEVVAGTQMTIKITTEGVEATYGTNGTVAMFADIADNGKIDTPSK